MTKIYDRYIEIKKKNIYIDYYYSTLVNNV